MDNRKKRIDDFLKYIRDIVLQNPDYDLTTDSVYHELTRLGVPEEEKTTKISNLFKWWINYYNHVNNFSKTKCKTFVDYRWSYFCQFVSKPTNLPDDLKVYIPLDLKHIQLGAIQIFDFLSKNGISHSSKIGSDIRFDDIVVRLSTPKDLKYLLDFLTKNKYIQEGLMPANPFLFNVNGIPLAVDGNLSFNGTIANLIKIYIKEKKNSNTLDSVNVDDFYNFVENYYQSIFVEKKDTQNKLKTDFDISKISDKIISNYKEVFELIIKSKESSFSLDNYIEHFNTCLKNKSQENPSETVNPDIIYSNTEIKEMEEKLLYIYDVMLERWKDEGDTISTITAYFKTGEEQYLTRKNNLREEIINSNLRQNVILFVSQLGQFDFYFQFYLMTLLNSRKKQKDSVDISNIEIEILETAKNILLSMMKTLESDIAINKFILAIISRDLNFLIIDNNFKEKLISSNFIKNFNIILNKNNISIYEYINNILGFEESYNKPNKK